MENNRKRKYKKYKRGRIIYANFSPQVGDELKGLHYAIVLNKDDNTLNSVITVLPMTSKIGKYNVPIGNMLYDELNKIQNKKINDFALIDEQYQNSLNNYYKFKNPTNESEKLNRRMYEIEVKLSQFAKKLIAVEARDLEEYLNKIRKNSYLKIRSITTISKDRIKKSPNLDLDNVIVPNEILDLIDEEIIKFLIKNK